jgi:hypothetical protein
MLSADEYLKKLQRENAEIYGPLLKNREMDFRNGDKSVLLGVIVICVHIGIPVPDWARRALWDAYTNPPKSWDDAFGRPLPKGKSAAVVRKHREKEYGIVVDVGTAKAPIDGDLFKRVAKKYNISGATAKRIYYAANRNLILSQHAYFKKLFQDSAAAGVDSTTYLQQHEDEFAAFARETFQEISQRLRNSKSARKQRTSQKSIKD